MAPEASEPPPGPGQEARCPACDAPRDGTARFCERCGYDIKAGRPSAVDVRVSLVLSTSRERWEQVVGEGEPVFPGELTPKRFELTGDHLTLGRARGELDDDLDIVLAGSAADPAVSHRQCELTRHGPRWVVRDLGSVNGTWINDAHQPLAQGEEHALIEGDRILMGAWTCLTVRLENR